MNLFSIKLLALIAMFLDHIGEFFPFLTLALPMRIAGRLAAPLFMFSSAVAVSHTSDSKRYLRRLYTASAIMGMGNCILYFIFPHSPVPCVNNFMNTLFLSACINALIRLYKNGCDKTIKYSLLFAFSQIIFSSVSFLGEAVLPNGINYLIAGIFPSIYTCEGSVLFVILGVLLFICQDNRENLKFGYCVFCGIYFLMTLQWIISQNLSLTFLFTADFQWMMIFSLPFMLLYNGTKGCSSPFAKYLFYAFYPLHIWLLFILSNL